MPSPGDSVRLEWVLSMLKSFWGGGDLCGRMAVCCMYASVRGTCIKKEDDRTDCEGSVDSDVCGRVTFNGSWDAVHVKSKRRVSHAHVHGRTRSQMSTVRSQPELQAVPVSRLVAGKAFGINHVDEIGAWRSVADLIQKKPRVFSDAHDLVRQTTRPRALTIATLHTRMGLSRTPNDARGGRRLPVQMDPSNPRAPGTGLLDGHQANRAFVVCGPPEFTALALVRPPRTRDVASPLPFSSWSLPQMINLAKRNAVSPLAGEIWLISQRASFQVLSSESFGRALFLFLLFRTLPY
ncbi:hypothetical protein EW146_g9906 [Bondarzewia mesenterica]|uniref:Uncharacterized protein n=1 Tax=Bondarzewia mesenterica TaxID=1095465 RepID=A0A4V3XCD6_9AGAM|nr:hypothetical protein EW146_g9906 [Bondarzewia mesenterica]